ncbi:MAG TPA: hypothetical protein DCL54_07770 [Alphaproteobacteria bacterium]|nr:hypothetical protein [Alphaproteobacteria bacterium]HAJ46461.1 hypothetical protein [Alphaproteobacteria bacterium]
MATVWHTQLTWFVLAICLVSFAPKQANALVPATPAEYDCQTLLETASKDGDQYDWRDLVFVEHCDRIKRLWRLTSEQGLGATPQFWHGDVEARRLPKEFGSNMPILRVVFPERVFFETDRADLREEALRVVEIVAESMRKEMPDVALFVAGHADSRGSKTHNYNLSVRRANAIAEAIMDRGINNASVWRVGFGKDLPLVAGESEESWALNRRVEFLFAPKPIVAATHLASSVDNACSASSEAETRKCLKNADPKPRVVVEIPKSKNRETVTPSSDGKVEVTPSTTHIESDPQAPSRMVVDPVGTRKILIDPINRKATTVAGI